MCLRIFAAQTCRSFRVTFFSGERAAPISGDGTLCRNVGKGRNCFGGSFHCLKCETVKHISASLIEFTTAAAEHHELKIFFYCRFII
jgi:hypothetical protein